MGIVAMLQGNGDGNVSVAPRGRGGDSRVRKLDGQGTLPAAFSAFPAEGVECPPPSALFDRLDIVVFVVVDRIIGYGHVVPWRRGSPEKLDEMPQALLLGRIAVGAAQWPPPCSTWSVP